GDWRVNESGAPVVMTPNGEVALEQGEYELINRVESSDAQAAANTASSAMPTGGFVMLDTALTSDLLAEGYARDAIRAVQDARKENGLDVTDRIALTLNVPSVDVAKVEQFRDLIANETLATSLEVTEADSSATELSVSLKRA
ncbi:hypothetical protein CG403_00290, partial [Gardnerella vaginalis]